MTSTTRDDHPSPRDLLAELRRLYGKRQIERDPFGRRTALPSEVARVIAQHDGCAQEVVGKAIED